MKHIAFTMLLVLFFLVACQPAPTPTPVPPSVTPTLMPTATATLMPTATATLTPTPAATNTPTVTATPTLAPMPIAAGAPVVNVVVHPENPGRTIAPDFVGMSYEAIDLASGVFDSKNATFLRLLQNLGPGTFRFGGNEVEYTYWSSTTRTTFPNAHATVIGSDLDNMFAFAGQANWRVILGLNLGHYDPEGFADEAQYAAAKGGNTLLAFEIGNEPDIYVGSGTGLRPASWGYNNYRTEFEAYVRAIRTRVPNAKIAGPAFSTLNPPAWGTDVNVDWYSRFLKDEAPQVVLATHHFYPMGNKPAQVPPGHASYPTIDNMLSVALMQSTLRGLDKSIQLTQAQNLPLQLGESNDVFGGGKPDVSDVFASALWGVDYMFSTAEHGVRGVNFHTARKWGCDEGSYNPICTNGSTYAPMPLYYGMLLFANAGKGRVVPVEMNASVNIVAHATLGDDGKLRVTLVNKTRTQAVAAQIKLGKPYATASALRLLAPALDAKTGGTFGGRAVNPDGTWVPGAAEPVVQNGDGFIIAVPAGSAVVVILE